MTLSKRKAKKTLRELEKIGLGDYPKFRLSGEYLAKVVKVYDGDTITVVMRIGSKEPFFEHSIRMYGYDTPELRPKKSKDYSKSRFNDRQDEIAHAKVAREYLSSLILGTVIKVEIITDDKNVDPFGRLLCKVYAPSDAGYFDFCVNNDMVDKGYGYEYYGDTKID